MIQPSKRFCDLCKLEIPQGRPFAAIPVAIPKALREKLMEEAAEQMKTQPMRMFPMFSADTMVAKAWNSEVCYGCLFGLMPDLLPSVEAEIRDYLRRRATARTQAEAAQQEYEVEISDEP